jgi:hypothetical protein
MRLPSTRLALAGLALPFVLATAAIAQPVPPTPPERPGHGPMMDPAARAEMRVRHLREVLQLRPDQEPALQAFLASHKRPEGMRERRMQERQAVAAMTTPQRLDRMLAHLDEARARMVAHADAVKRFYGALSPSQQKAFDALHSGHGMGMGMRHRFRHGGGMGGPMGGPGMHGPRGGPGVDAEIDEDFAP